MTGTPGHIRVSSRATIKTKWRATEAAKRRVIDGESYLVQRNGAWLRPEAHGYTLELYDAGFFAADVARGYLDVLGLSVIPVKSVADQLIKELAVAEERVHALRKIVGEILA